MGKTNPISSELVEIQNLLTNSYQPDCSLLIENNKADSFVNRINVLASLARSLEDELAVYRVQNTQNADAAILEDLAGEYLLGAVEDTVVSIDFKVQRKSKEGGAG